MSGFIQGEDRSQATLFPERLDAYVAEDSAVRVIDVFIDELDLSGLGFKTQPNDTGRPAYHPATMLKLFVYGYLNRVHSSRRLEREAQRNVELMWLTGRLAPDFKTIADFRKDNGVPIRLVCRQFVILCRNLNLFANAFVAIDGSKFKAVNNRHLILDPTPDEVQESYMVLDPDCLNLNCHIGTTSAGFKRPLMIHPVNKVSHHQEQKAQYDDDCGDHPYEHLGFNQYNDAQQNEQKAR